MVSMLSVVILMSLCGLSASTFDAVLHEKFQTMPRREYIDYFNRQNYTWKMAQHGFPFTKGCSIEMPVRNYPVALKHQSISLEDLPTNFDPREKWPHCVSMKEIYDQGDCGSCWAFGTTSAISDRICVHLNKTARISVQDLECCSKCLGPIGVCGGSNPFKALKFWENQGLVTQACKPYNITKLKKNTCEKKCVDANIDYTADKHYGKSYEQISSKEIEIKAELFKNGPVEVYVKVYEEFNYYNGGIYVHKAGKKYLPHSVKLMGYGEENGVKYWLAANSWGTSWGEKGFFRIKAYQNMGIEDQVLAPWPKS